MTPEPQRATSARVTRETPRERETRAAGSAPLLRHHSEWEERFPGVRAGITGPRQDFGLSGSASAWEAAGRYRALGRRLGFDVVVVGRQVHGTRLAVVDQMPGRGFLITGDTDGLATGRRGVLLTVTAADCVPVYLLAPELKVAALLHAGWRGTAAGILRAGISRLGDRFGVRADELWVHLGPAVCGECYEVGPEVLEALGRSATGKGHVDLRRVLARRARRAGVSGGRVSVSAWCTACEPDHFHSYRGRANETGRMAAFLGWR